MDKRKLMIIGGIFAGAVLLIALGILFANSTVKKADIILDRMIDYYEEVSDDFKSADRLEFKGVIEDIRVIIGEEERLKAVLYGQVPGNYDNVPKLQLKKRKNNYFIEVKYKKNKVDLPKGSLKLDLYIPGHYKGGFSVDTYSGNVEIADWNNTDILINTVSGSIHGENLESGNLVAQSVSGNIELSDIICLGTIDARSTSGNVFANNVEAKNIQSASVSGTISVDGNIGGVVAETVSGYMDIRLKSLKDNVSLTGVSGDITLLLNASAAFNLNVETVSGEITVESFEVGSGKSDKGLLQGKINGGGPAVKIKTTSGNVTIDRNTK